MIYNRIQELRENLGLNQEELAEKLNIQRTYLSKIENNKYPPSPKLMEDICIFFNKTLNDIFYIVRV